MTMPPAGAWTALKVRPHKQVRLIGRLLTYPGQRRYRYTPPCAHSISRGFGNGGIGYGGERMSMPPQGGWPPQQPGPHLPGQPQYGPPSGYQPHPGQQPYPTGQWPQQPPAPQKGGDTTKWLLVAIAVLLVIGVTIGATLLFTRDGDDASTPPPSGVASDIASANDTGPVSIITEEPTCAAFNSINNSLADIQQRGWGDLRGNLGPVSTWTPEQRAQVDAVAGAMRNAADQVVALARQTPHRVVREIYEQFIAYGRAYADSVQEYTPRDDGLASVNVNASSAMIGICNVIEYGAAGRSIALTAEPTPTAIAPASVGEPTQFITSPNPACRDWTSRLDRLMAETPEWQNRDGSIPASSWPPERRAVEVAARPLLTAYAAGITSAGRQSGNPILEDLASAAAVYIRGYVAAGDQYTNADSWLIHTGFRLSNLVAGACRAVAD